MSLRRKGSLAAKRLRGKSSERSRVESMSDASSLVADYMRLYPPATLNGRKVIRADLEQRLKHAEKVANNRRYSEENRQQARAVAAHYKNALETLPPVEKMPKKVRGPRKGSPLKGRSKRSTPKDIQKREEAATTRFQPPSTEEEPRAPPSLKVKSFTKKPTKTEKFFGDKLELERSWDISDPDQLITYRKTMAAKKRVGYVVRSGQWKGRVYLYTRLKKEYQPPPPTPKTTKRTDIPVASKFGKVEWKSDPFGKGRVKYYKAGIYDNIAELESKQNNLRKEGHSTFFVRVRRGTTKSGKKSIIGYILYKRRIQEPKRIPVKGGGASGKTSPRRFATVKKSPKFPARPKAGDKLERWIGGKKTELRLHKEPSTFYTDVSKEADRLRRKGYFVVEKSYDTETGVTYVALFKSEKKSKERADEYKKKARRKPKYTELSPAPPTWRRKVAAKMFFAEPKKPHPKAVLLRAIPTGDVNAQGDLSKEEKVLQKQGVTTAISIGSQMTHLYAIPEEGQESLFLPQRPIRQEVKERPVRIYRTKEEWAKHGVDIKDVRKEQNRRVRAK